MEVVMMHSASFVVTLRDSRGRKPFREYNHAREGNTSETTVLLPFDTEYQFAFKVLDGSRRRVCISIDGVSVADDLVLNPGESYLERLMENNRKFKFVRLSHSDVADPSSPSNGRVEIMVWKEKAYVYPMTEHMTVTLTSGCFRHSCGPRYGAGTPDFMLGKCNMDNGNLMMGPTSTDFCDSSSVTSIPCSMTSAGASNAIVPDMAHFNKIPLSSRGLSAPMGEAGATVEGSKSHQSFQATTWAGDESPTPDIFIIYLRGKEATVEPPKVNSSKVILCESCSLTSPAGSKFCCNCGGRF
jgi:hypothetical protein